jgi:tetratricopeptide (TPR) repeat protein
VARFIHHLSGIAVALAAALAGAQTPVEYNNRGIEAYNKGQFRPAVQYFERAYEGAPDSATVRRNLCNAHQAVANELAQAGNYQEAVRHLEVAIGVEPRNPSPLVQLGSYYLRMDLVREAIYRLEEAIEVKPGELDAHELLGEAYYRDNDLSSARAQWDYVLEVDPSRDMLRQRYEKAFREESVEYDFNRAGSRHFKITYPKSVPVAMRSRVLTMLERAYMEVGRKFGGVYPPSPVQVVVYDAEGFSDATQLASHVGAVYDGKIRAPLTNAEGQWLAEDEIKRRLTHEYVHVVVRHLGGPNVPWWLN